ncbi:MAG: GAF domain-containing protein [Deltaproteobacteria bacterium]|nr:GAF domain-containing protein [Deltaproteobacteria bacterium]
MNLGKWFYKFSLEKQGLYYKLSVIFGLFFLVPIAGFMYFAMKYDILSDEYIPIYFMIFLLFSFFGFIMLRKMFDEISRISRDISQVIETEFSPSQTPLAEDELKGIVHSFQTLEHELRSSFRNLEKKTSEISTLKELSDLCYMTFNTEDLLYITLERALKLAGADIGSVMILEKPKRDVFVIEASIGLSDFAKKGDRTSFADSVAKYAVINKAPFLVEDIETDMRIGRQSRPQYSTKSFICMPLKTINDVIGVLTVSRRKLEKPFTQEDVDVLIPLLSNAAFTYDNLRLLRENEYQSMQIKTMENLSSIINSSFRGSELLHAIFHEMRAVIPYELAIVMILDEDTRQYLHIVDFLTFIPTGLNKSHTYPFDGTIFSKVMKQQRPLMLHDMDSITHPVEMEIFIAQGARNAFLAPLKTEGQVTGILILCNLPHETVSNADNVIESMADSLSRAIEKEKLLIAFARRNQELDTLRQIGGALAASTFDMDKVLQHTMDMIQVIMDVEAGSLMLLDGNELEFKVAFNIIANVDILKGSRFKLGKGIAGYSAARGESVIVRNAKESKHFHPDFDRMTGFESRSVLCVPLISQGKVLGVIEVLNKRQGEFAQGDLQLLQSIATTVSIAMENARLYGETLTMAEKERAIRNMFQKFVPKEVIDKITHGTEERPVIDEFKIITLLDIDIRGYSILSHKVGPQKTVAILNYFFAAMGEIVFKHHGIVDKYLGDGFLALFGAPVSSPSDADNAISAALEMQKAMEGVTDYLQKRFGASLTMGVSIHTGEVVVGNIGFDKKMDYTVIGDSVNFVFKLQSLCKPWPNGILISEKTYYACQSPLNVEEIDHYAPDNNSEKLKIYRIIGQEKTNV